LGESWTTLVAHGSRADRAATTASAGVQGTAAPPQSVAGAPRCPADPRFASRQKSIRKPPLATIQLPPTPPQGAAPHLAQLPRVYPEPPGPLAPGPEHLQSLDTYLASNNKHMCKEFVVTIGVKHGQSCFDAWAGCGGPVPVAEHAQGRQTRGWRAVAGPSWVVVVQDNMCRGSI
jgi:hypothetical protein